MMKCLLSTISLLIVIDVTLACIGSGCVHDRERDQFFWCSGNADKEIPAIRAYYGGQVNRQSYISYCTGVSAMLVTTDPGLRRIGERLCGGNSHEVVCHEDISGRGLKK